MSSDGSALPSGGTLTAFEPPSGRGLRVDTCGYAGYTTNPALRLAARQARRALALGRLRGRARERVPRARRVPDRRRGDKSAVPAEPAVPAGARGRRESARASSRITRPSSSPARAAPSSSASSRRRRSRRRSGVWRARASMRAIRSRCSTTARRAQPLPRPPARSRRPRGCSPCALRSRARSSSVDVREGELVAAGQPLLVMEAMKMEHVDRSRERRRGAAHRGGAGRHGLRGARSAAHGGLGRRAGAARADAGDRPRAHPARSRRGARRATRSASTTRGPTRSRGGARPASAPRARTSTDLCDPGTFVEYGPLVIAAQRRRRTLEDLIARTPADGLVAGIGAVNAALFGESAARCVLMSYDYTVLAGTQGMQNHRKKDRMFELAEKLAPAAWCSSPRAAAAGPATPTRSASPGLDCMAFHYFGGLSGLVPLVGDHLGPLLRRQRRAARLLRRRDRDARLEHRHGRPGHDRGRRARRVPARGGRPDRRAGAATAWSTSRSPTRPRRCGRAKQYLSYFQGALARLGRAPTSACCARSIPENRLRVYDVRRVIETLADTGSVLELRRGFGPGMVTALARIEGRPIGVIANNPTHLAGAIDSDGADKAARFMQLCDAFDLPLLFLCDTPGIMVGPEAEKTALVRHASRHVRDRREPDRAVLHDRAAQGLRPRRAGDGGRQLQGAALHRRLADRRVRRDGSRGRGEARLPQRARRDRRPGRAQGAVRADGASACTSTARRVNDRLALRDRRRDRPGRLAHAGSRARCARCRRRRRAPARSAPASTPGERGRDRDRGAANAGGALPGAPVLSPGSRATSRTCPATRACACTTSTRVRATRATPSCACTASRPGRTCTAR